jgi:hypothetical protein
MERCFCECREGMVPQRRPLEWPAPRHLHPTGLRRRRLLCRHVPYLRIFTQCVLSCLMRLLRRAICWHRMWGRLSRTFLGAGSFCWRLPSSGCSAAVGRSSTLAVGHSVLVAVGP